MNARRRLIVAIAVFVATAGSGCSDSSGPGFSLADVAGRDLQPAWWEAIPDLPEPGPNPEPIALPPSGLTIPADTLFDVGSATVRTQSVDELQVWANDLVPHLATTLGTWTIAGATDSTGSAESNDSLGLERARAVLDVIAAVEGVDRDRFQVESWGESRPEVDEATAADVEEARARNRRVVLLPPDPS